MALTSKRSGLCGVLSAVGFVLGTGAGCSGAFGGGFCAKRIEAQNALRIESFNKTTPLASL